MTDRFSALRLAAAVSGVATLCVLTALIAFAGLARAASIAVPADAPVVATTPSGATVLAWVKGGRTCVGVQLPGTPRPSRVDDGPAFDADARPAPGGCGTTPTLSRFDGEQLGTYESGDRTTVAWGWAGTQTARVQLKDGATVLADATTAPAPLPGPAGLLRFWAADHVTGATPRTLAFLDAAGVVRGAVDPFGSEPGGEESRARGGSPAIGTLLQSGRAGAIKWQLRRVTSTELRPTPLQPERRAERSCLVTRVRARGTDATRSSFCDHPHAFDRVPLVAETSMDCSLGLQVTVLATAAVRRVVVVLGDGTRRAVPLATFGGGVRAGLGVVGFGMAVRGVLALGADGRVLHAAAKGGPPVHRPTASAPCFRTIGGSRWARAAGDPPLGPAPHVMRFADHGLELCARADAAPRIPQDCAIPPALPRDTSVRFFASADGLFGFGVVGDEVAGVRVTLADGTRRTAASTPLAGYTGIYAGVLRQVAIDVPDIALRRVELLDDRGRVLNAHAGQDGGGGDDALEGAITLLPAARGIPAARAAPIDFGSESATCLTSGALERFRDCDAVVFPGQAGLVTVQVEATCAPRRLVVTALLARASERLVVRTTAGREVDATRVRIPSAAGDGGAGRFYARAVLGPRDGIDAALLRGRVPARVPVGLPPAARQCGYSDAAGLAAFFGAGSR